MPTYRYSGKIIRNFPRDVGLYQSIFKCMLPMQKGITANTVSALCWETMSRDPYYRIAPPDRAKCLNMENLNVGAQIHNYVQKNLLLLIFLHLLLLLPLYLYLKLLKALTWTVNFVWSWCAFFWVGFATVWNWFELSEIHMVLSDIDCNYIVTLFNVFSVTTDSLFLVVTGSCLAEWTNNANSEYCYLAVNNTQYVPKKHFYCTLTVCTMCAHLKLTTFLRLRVTDVHEPLLSMYWANNLYS